MTKITDIITSTCKYYEQSEQMVVDKLNNDKVNIRKCRAVIVWVARKHGYTWKEIGAALCRDHTTAIHLFANVSDYTFKGIEADAKFLLNMTSEHSHQFNIVTDPERKAEIKAAYPKGLGMVWECECGAVSFSM